MLGAETRARQLQSGASLIASPLQCPACGVGYHFSASLIVHLQAAHGMTGWGAILYTSVVGEKGGR